MTSPIITDIKTPIITPVFDRFPAFRHTVIMPAPGTFSFPFEATGDYEDLYYRIDSDAVYGPINTWNQAETTTPILSAGEHVIEYFGEKLHGWRFNNSGDKLLMGNIKSHGPGFFRYGDNDGNLYGCSNATITAKDIPDFTGKTSLQNFYRGMSSLTTVPNMGLHDVSLMTSFGSMCRGNALFNEPGISLWRAPLISKMNSTFNGCLNFDQNLGGWIITSLTNATSFLLNVTMPTPNYNNLWLGWSPQDVNDGVVFSGGNSMASGAGVLARTHLWLIHMWTITDGDLP